MFFCSYRAIAQRELEDERKKQLTDPMDVYQNSTVGEGVGSGIIHNSPIFFKVF